MLYVSIGSGSGGATARCAGFAGCKTPCCRRTTRPQHGSRGTRSSGVGMIKTGVGRTARVPDRLRPSGRSGYRGILASRPSRRSLRYPPYDGPIPGAKKHDLHPKLVCNLPSGDGLLRSYALAGPGATSRAAGPSGRVTVAASAGSGPPPQTRQCRTASDAPADGECRPPDGAAVCT